jgi:YD repeat-containing protein
MAGSGYTTAVVDPAPLTAAGADPFQTTVCTPLGGDVLATFNDGDTSHSPDDYQAVLDWGDGTSAAGLISGGNGDFSVTGPGHVYFEPGSFTIGVRVTDENGIAAEATVAVSVQPVQVPDGLAAEGVPFDAVEASPYSGVVATFTDPEALPAGAYGAQVDWGDGSTEADLIVADPQQPGSYDVLGSPTYAEHGSYGVGVSVTAPGRSAVTFTTSRVADADLTATDLSLTLPANVAFQDALVARFTDGNPNDLPADYDATIDWGDGSGVEAGTVWGSGGELEVSGSHTYAQPGSYLAAVTLDEPGGNRVQTLSTITVTEAGEGVAWPGAAEGPGGAGSVFPGEGDPGLPLDPGSGEGGSGSGGSGPVVLAWFTDFNVPGNNLSDYSAVISWGDGSTAPGAINQVGPDLYQVTTGDASHVYEEEGLYLVSALILDDGGSTAEATMPLLVADQPLTPEPLARALAGQVGQTLADVQVAGFRDPNSLAQDDYTASIDWGDGTTSDGAVVEDPNDPGAYQVTGTHTYDQPGVFTISTTIADPGGSTVVVGAEADIASTADIPWLLSAGQRRNDVSQATWVPEGQASVAPNTGSLRLTHTLDFDQSPGTSVGRDPALVYNSDTVDARPILEATLLGSPVAVPVALEAQLTFNGSAQGWVSFDPSGHLPGQPFVFDLQVQDRVAASGAYPWEIEVRATLADGSVVDRDTTGLAQVVVNDASPYGAGWSLNEVNRLVLDTAGGALLVYGTGESRYFAREADGSFVSPPEDFGTLMSDCCAGGYIYVAKDQTRWLFDAQGRQTEIVDRDGLVWSYGYTGDLLTSVTVPDSSTTLFSYDATRLLENILEPGNRLFTAVHDEAGNLTGLIDVDGSLRGFGYDAGHRLVSDQWGPTSVAYAYDPASGLLSGIDQGLGTTVAVVAAALPGLSEVLDAPAQATLTDGRELTTAYTLDLLGRGLETDTPDGGRQEWLRDEHGQVVLAIDPLGYATLYFYAYGPGRGDLVRQVAADGGVTDYAYDPVFHELTATADPMGRLTRYFYNDTGDQVLQIDPLGLTTVSVWQDGLLLSQTDPRGKTTYYQYDAARRLAAETDAAAATTQYAYDAAGNPASTLDARLRLTVTAYDARNRLVAQTNPAGDSESWAYNPLGEEVAHSDGRGVLTVITYDMRGWKTSETEGFGTALALTTLYFLDADGNVVSTIDPRLKESYTFYDALNRPIQSIDNDGYSTFTTYDADGNIIQSVDADGNITRDSYDPMGRQLTEQVFAPGGLVLVKATRTSYDRDGEVLASTDGDHGITRDAYDSDGRLIAQKDPDGYVTTTGYDGDGNVIQSVDADGNVTRMTYDGDGRVLTTTVYAGHSQVVVDFTSDTYDGDGNLLSSTNGDNNTTFYGYDGDGRLVSQSDPDHYTTFTSYDGDGNVTSTTDANGNFTENGYDTDGRLVSVQVFTPVGSNLVLVEAKSYAYDQDGNMIQSTDGDSNSTKYFYDGDGRLIQQIDADGYSTYTAYDGNGNVISTIDANLNTTIETYDALGRVVGEQVYDSHHILVSATSDTYDADGNLLRSTDGDNQPTRDFYDADGRLIQQIDPIGFSTYTSYDGDGNVIKSVDADGNTTLDSYDAMGRRLSESVYDAEGALVSATSDTYDKAGNLVSSTDGDQQTTFDFYDGDGRLIQEQDPDHFSTYTSYDGDGNIIQTIDADGNYIKKSYDALGRVLSETVLAPDDQTVVAASSNLYDLAGRLVASSDGDSKITTYGYDRDGRLTSQTDPDHNTTTTAYDGDGNVIATIDPNGNTTSEIYDALGRVLFETVTAADGTVVQVTSNTYDADGNLLASTDGDGQMTHDFYDADGRLIQQQDADLFSTFTSYDGDGNVIQTVDANGNTTMDMFDALGRVTGEQVYDRWHNLVRTTSDRYDADGNLLSSTDGDNQTTVDFYDADGRLIKQTDPAGDATSTFYDGDGNVIKTIDPDHNITKDSYDAAGRLLSETVYAPDGQTVVAATSNTYDLAGHLVSSKDGDGKSTIYGYDDAGRLTSQTDPDQHTTSSVYDGDGNIIQITDRDGNITKQTFDALGRMTSVTVAWGTTAAATTSYTFDGAGNLVLQKDADGHTMQYTYDRDNRLVQTTDQDLHTTSTSYDGDGNVIDTTDADGNVRRDTCDAFGHVLTEKLFAPGGQILVAATSNSYDPDGHLMSSIDADHQTTTYGYDVAGRLTSETDPDHNTTTTGYDGDGNVIQTTDPDHNITKESYDAAGRLVGDQVFAPDGTTLIESRSNSYDAAGHLLSSTDGEDQTTTYGYDDAGRLTSQTDAYQKTTQTAYDGDGNVTLITDPNGNKTRQTYDQAGHRTSVTVGWGSAAAATTSYTFDGNGNVTSITDPDHNTTRYAYERRFGRAALGGDGETAKQGPSLSLTVPMARCFSVDFRSFPRSVHLLASWRGGRLGQ